MAARDEKVRAERARPPRLRPVRLHARAGAVAGQLVRPRPRGGAGARGRRHRGRARVVDRGPGGVDDGARLRGRVRAQAQRAVGVDPAVPAVPGRRSWTRGGRCGCCTWTCSCCWPSAPRTCSSTAARSACRCRWCTRCCCTCWCAWCWPGCGRGATAGGCSRSSRWPGWRSLLVLLVGFRVGLNVTDSNVIDVGYAGVIGADRIVDGDGLYGPKFSEDVERGDTYGPVNYLLYVPFEQAMPWSGAWDDLPAAHGAALAFDLLTLAGLVLLGLRLRPGPAGRELGVALGFAWAAYPYALFALETNSNDSLVGAVHGGGAAGADAAPGAVGGRPGRGGGAGGGRQVRHDRAGAADGGRHRRAARARRRAVRAWCWRVVLAAGVRAVPARRRPPRGLRPHGRLPGLAPVAVQRLGPGRLARLAADRGQGRGRRRWRWRWPSCPAAATRSRWRRWAPR